MSAAGAWDAPLPLSGQVALVTGCGRRRGLGHGIALALAAAGADVAVNDLRPQSGEDRLAGVATEIANLERRSIALIGDVGVKADADRIVAGAVDQLGRLDILVNNAATGTADHHHLSWEIPEAAYDEVLRVNAKGVFLMSTAAIRRFLASGTRGRIINIASDAGRRGYAHRSAYSASKFAVIGLTQSMAQELAPHGITVNAICPGLMDTAKRPDQPDAAVAAIRVPVGRQGTPADVARTVVFLADPGAGYITGQSLSVDGGLLM